MALFPLPREGRDFCGQPLHVKTFPNLNWLQSNETVSSENEMHGENPSVFPSCRAPHEFVGDWWGMMADEDPLKA